MTTQPEQAADKIEDSEWLQRGMRLGLVAYGIVHLLLAWLALQLAFGSGAGAASQQGALHELAQKPLGKPLLWIIALALVALACWQAIQAVIGHDKHDGAKLIFKRVGSGARVVIYLALAFSAIKTALGDSSSSGKDGMTSQVMSWPFGRFLVGAVGVGIIAVGGYLVSKAWRRSFEDDLQREATSGSTGTAIVRLAQAGYTAKGVSLAIVGMLFVAAAWNYNAKQAGGLDVALHSLLQQPYGAWLLAAVAVGIGCFGLYCFAWAKYADTSS